MVLTLQGTSNRNRINTAMYTHTCEIAHLHSNFFHAVRQIYVNTRNAQCRDNSKGQADMHRDTNRAGTHRWSVARARFNIDGGDVVIH